MPRSAATACSIRTGPRPGLTLVELMVVIAIVGTLMALLLPAVQAAREGSRRASCSNNLKQLALAAQSHVTQLGHFPTGGWSSDAIGDPASGADSRQPGGWAFTLLPFLDAANLYNGDSVSLVTTNVPVLVCPTRRSTGLVVKAVTGPAAIDGQSVWMHADYAGNRGSWASPTPADGTVLDRATAFMPTLGSETISLPLDSAGRQTIETTLNAQQAIPSGASNVSTGGVIYAGSALPPASIRDGFATTYLFGEKYVPRDGYTTGTATGDSQCAYVGDSPDTLRGGHRAPEPDLSTGASLAGGFGGPHTGVFNVAMCDGSVRSVGFEISSQVHFLLAARADRQPVKPLD